MTHALIVGAAPEPGHDPYYRRLMQRAGLVVAADAAAEWCEALGRTPDLAVGDFDSAVPGAVERLRAAGVEVETHPAEKDFSDLDLAVDAARRRGASSITITAASRLRLDHTLAALGTLSRAADLNAELDEPLLAAFALDADSRAVIDLEGPDGALVSVFAVDDAAGVTLTGFRYPLTAAHLSALSSRGLSNVLTGGAARVTVGTGRLVVVTVGPPATRAVCASSH
jgi:thiamine pyrophosphokinase